MLLEAGVSPFVETGSSYIKTTPFEQLFDLSILQGRLPSADDDVFDAEEFIARDAEYYQHNEQYKAQIVDLLEQMQVKWSWIEEEKEFEEAKDEIAEAWQSIQAQAMPKNYKDLKHYARVLTNVAEELSWLQ